MSGRTDRWHENAVIYAVDVEAFQDSGGDVVLLAEVDDDVASTSRDVSPRRSPPPRGRSF